MASTKIIDKYNFELSELLNVRDVKDDYVVLMNNNDSSDSKNLKIKVAKLNDYFTLKTDANIILMQEQIGIMQQKLSELENQNADLKERINLCEQLLSL